MAVAILYHGSHQMLLGVVSIYPLLAMLFVLFLISIVAVSIRRKLSNSL